jgi:hypothetical protein
MCFPVFNSIDGQLSRREVATYAKFASQLAAHLFRRGTNEFRGVHELTPHNSRQAASA